MEKENFVTKSGKPAERFVLAKLTPEAMELLRSKKHLCWVDQVGGKAYATPMRVKPPLSQEEIASREAKKAKKKEAFNKRVLANIQKKKAELEAREARYA